MLRAVARRLWPERSETRLIAELRHMRGVTRIASMFLLTILLPGIALAWIGVDSSRGEELAVRQSVREEGEREVRDVVNGVEGVFSDFEATVQRRLASGRNPVDTSTPPSDFVLVGFRMDKDGTLAAPFLTDTLPPLRDQSFYFSEEWRTAQALEAVDPALSARAYGLAANNARAIHERGEAEYNRARMLGEAGDIDGALEALANVYADFGEVRSLHGFRLRDLAELRRGRLLLEKDPQIGAGALQALVERILDERWVLGRGGRDAAIANRALELIEDQADGDWVATARGRLEEKLRRLYWAEQLQDELETLNPEGRALPVDRGQFTYVMGDQALWATLWWGEAADDYYLFALDLDAVVAEVETRARRATRTSSSVNMVVLTPGSDDPRETLARRSLNPWLTGYGVAVHPRSPEDLDAAQRQKRLQRISMVVLAIFMIGVGAVLTVRMVSGELEIARTKADFAANVSHELRSPITQIRLKGEALQFGLVESPDELQEHYDAIVRESERLSRLVDNVLDFAAIERGAKKYMFRPVALAETLYSAIEAARYSMETRDLVMEVEISRDVPMTFHDPEAIAQVLHNLISNAAKYGQEGGWIGITADLVGDHVEVKVSDRGIGIDAEELPLLFEHFYRSGDPAARRKKGTGIGLTIVRYIMEAHDGRVEVTSTKGVGTTFTLHFPLKPPESASQA
jgi:two-component system phosphate regulon sensor histidine kinase PhoR